MAAEQSINHLRREYREFGAGGFSRLDGSVEFYGRINALLKSSDTVLDIGAGRGAWFEDDPCEYRKSLRLLRGKAREVIAVDIDPAVTTNRSVDRAIVMGEDEPLPIASESVDILIADYVFEHVTAPAPFSTELSRVLKPGGWICARTPNKWGLVSVATRIVRNDAHDRVLRLAQPGRKALDVFPTAFRMNTLSAIDRYFPTATFESFSYTYHAEPSYFFGNLALLKILRLVDQMTPRVFEANLFLFLRKRT